MSETEYTEVETLTLEMEDGVEHEFAIIDIFNAQEVQYIVLSEIVDDEIMEESYIFRYAENGDDILIDDIDDDEYEMAKEAYAHFLFNKAQKKTPEVK